MKKLLYALLFTILGIGLGFVLFKNAPSALIGGECKSPIAVYEDPSRIPLRNFLLDGMGDLTGKAIADIGAGTGFFAFEMAKSADKVYATELDPLFLSYMSNKVGDVQADNFEVLSAQADHSELNKIKVDEMVLVYVFHFLDHPSRFLDAAKSALNDNGNIHIMNSQYKPQVIIDYLERGGFEDISKSSFSFAQEGCGPIDVQLIRGTKREKIALN